MRRSIARVADPRSLNADQRKNYLVRIVDGKLVWDRNGKPVDTSKRKHKDAGHGRGIVDIEDDEDGPAPGSDSSSEYSSSDSSIGEQNPNRDAHEHCTSRSLQRC